MATILMVVIILAAFAWAFSYAPAKLEAWSYQKDLHK